MATDTPLDVKKAKKEKKEKKRKRDIELAVQAVDESAPKKHKKSKTSEVTTEQPLAKEKKSSKGSDRSKSTQLFSEGDLQQRSPFVRRTLSFYVTLSPCAHNFPLEGICAEHISPLLLTYYPPLEGVLLSYTNPRLSNRPESKGQTESVYAQSIDEYGVTFTWVTAEFLLFQPKRGTYLEGYVNLQNESLLGLMCYNYFNAVIERDQLPAGWNWTAEDDSAESEAAAGQGSGHFVNENGDKVEGRVVFRVRDFDAIPGGDANSGGMIHIYGTLLPSENGTASRSA